MDEYIAREALLSDIDAAMENSGMGYIIGQTLKRYVKRQPAADVAPVRHGRWLYEPKFGSTRPYHCSLPDCGASFPGKFLFCPNCGAWMDGDG